MTGSDVWTWGVDLPANHTSSDIIVKSVELIDPEGLVVIGMAMTNPRINGGVVAVRGFPPPDLVAFPVEGAVMTPRSGGSSELEVLVGLARSSEGTAGSVGGIRVRYTAGGRDSEVVLPYTLHSTEPGPPAPSSPLLLGAQAAGQTLTVTTDSAGLTTGVAGSGGTTWSYRYDSANRMVSACRAASCSGTGFDRADYGYDGAGHRTRITTTTAAGAVTVLDIAYTGDIPAQDRVNGTVTRTYLADDTGRIVRFCDPDCTGTNPVYLVAWNAHGDAVSIGRLDPATGGVTPANRFTYATWGAPTTTTANGHPDLGFRYLWVGAAGVSWDNSAGQALYDMHARTYSPVLGRFLQPDPARADGNLYAYAGNSPVTRVDPSGLMPQWLWCLGHPAACIYARQLADKLVRQSIAIFGQKSAWNGRGDAWRHCTWIGCVAAAFSPTTAIDLGEAHEADEPNQPDETRMDLHNNRVGARIGNWQDKHAGGWLDFGRIEPFVKTMCFVALVTKQLRWLHD